MKIESEMHRSSEAKKKHINELLNSANWPLTEIITIMLLFVNPKFCIILNVFEFGIFCMVFAGGELRDIIWQPGLISFIKEWPILNDIVSGI